MDLCRSINTILASVKTSMFAIAIFLMIHDAKSFRRVFNHNVRAMKYYSYLTFVGHSGPNRSAFYLESATSHTPLWCICASIKGRSSCTVISVPCNKIC